MRASKKSDKTSTRAFLHSDTQKRLLLRVAYNGGAFRGWQSQQGGETVQDVMEAALTRIVGVPIRLYGAGRTDAGVHALGQCAHFDVPKESRLAPADWLRALNTYLPPQIRVLSVKGVSSQFHARFSARGKHYRYLIDTSLVLSPFSAGRVWHIPFHLDFDLLRTAIASVRGKHDFRAFAANRGKPEQSTVRTIYSAKAVKVGYQIRIDLIGDGFLYKMVRMLVGAAARIACGKETTTWMQAMLGAPQIEKNKYVAPAQGLYLVKVIY